MENENNKIQKLLKSKLNNIILVDKFRHYFPKPSLEEEVSFSINVQSKCKNSEWFLPKEKQNLPISPSTPKSASSGPHYLLTQEEQKLYKNLGSNLIVTGRITQIKAQEGKKCLIEVKLERVVSLCYEGDNLINDPASSVYLDYSHTNGPCFDYLQTFKNLYENLYAHNISGYIKKHDIYDNKFPHLNEDIDNNLVENKMITCVIIRNKLNEYDDEIFSRDEFLQMSLKNSIIKNASQHFISNSHQQLKIPFSLGVNYSTENSRWIDKSDNIMLKSTLLMNESILKNLVGELHIDQYQSLFEKFKTVDQSGFSYEKLRKVQNYDWADEYIRKGNDMMEIKNYEKAIEYFKDAEKLDSLNKEVYIKKGLCFLQLDKIEYSKKEFKNCLKIEPNDETAIQYLTYITKREKQNQVDKYEQMLSKKRENFK